MSSTGIYSDTPQLTTVINYQSTLSTLFDENFTFKNLTATSKLTVNGENVINKINSLLNTTTIDVNAGNNINLNIGSESQCKINSSGLSVFHPNVEDLDSPYAVGEYWNVLDRFNRLYDFMLYFTSGNLCNQRLASFAATRQKHRATSSVHAPLLRKQGFGLTTTWHKCCGKASQSPLSSGSLRSNTRYRVSWVWHSRKSTLTFGSGPGTKLPTLT